MASREMRRIRDRLSGKEKIEEKGKKKFNPFSIFTLVIIGLVLVGLVWWGKSGNYSGAVINFGAYDGRSIVWMSGNFFARKVAEAMETPTLYGEKLTDEQALRNLIPYMIFHTAVMVEAEKNGLTVSDTEIEEYIKAIGLTAFYNKAESAERHDLFQVYKEELIELKLMQSLIQSYDNKALEAYAARMGEDERKFKFVQWKYDDYPMQEIAKFAAENKDLFRTIKLSRIATKTESEARDAYKKIISRESNFNDQLKAISKPESEGAASLDWQSYYSLENVIHSKEAVDKIFALKQDEISEVVAVGSEWLIYRCDQEAVPADLASPKSIAEIKAYILDAQKGRVESYFEGEAKQFLENASKQGLAAAASAAKLKVYETGFFPINYNPAAYDFLKKIPDMKDTSTTFESAQSDLLFFKEAFALKKGDFSKPILLPSSRMVIVCELADQRTPAPEDLEKIRTDFKNMKDLDTLNFYYIIADRLYLRGKPVLGMQMYLEPIQYHNLVMQGASQYLQQIRFDPYRLMLNQEQFYQRFVDLDKMGTPEERQERIDGGIRAFHDLHKEK